MRNMLNMSPFLVQVVMALWSGFLSHSAIIMYWESVRHIEPQSSSTRKGITRASKFRKCIHQYCLDRRISIVYHFIGCVFMNTDFDVGNFLAKKWPRNAKAYLATLINYKINYCSNIRIEYLFYTLLHYIYVCVRCFNMCYSTYAPTLGLYLFQWYYIWNCFPWLCPGFALLLRCK